MFNIKKHTIYNSSYIDDDVSIINAISLTKDEANIKLVTIAESHRNESNLIQHNTGRSIVYFGHKRIEFTRI